MHRLFLRFTSGIVVVLPIAALLATECGGNDVIGSADASGDVTIDTNATEGASDTSADRPADSISESVGMADAADANMRTDGNTGPDADAGLRDGEGGSGDAAEGGDAEGGDAGAGRGDSGDAQAGSDAGDAEAGGMDAGDAEGGFEAGPILLPPVLGTARTFSVLAGATITNTGVATAVFGDVGISPGTALVGLTAGQVTGTIHLGDAVAMQAEADTTTAYNDLAGRPCQFTMTNIDLGGKTLPPGVYCFAISAAQAVGNLTLDGLGDPNAVWIFQIASTLTIASNLSTVMINGGNACNVYWQVGSSATINGGAQFKGNILAQASISLLTGASVSPGRTLAQTAAVTMDNSAISNAGCP
ncbi:MAG: ice-binding family protein [Myxococcota bacterium]|nr:ice-binding family protein [Myxococcota bacterium]